MLNYRQGNGDTMRLSQVLKNAGRKGLRCAFAAVLVCFAVIFASGSANASTLSGKVFLDIDMNGVQNGTEFGISGIAIDLHPVGIDLSTDPAPLYTTTTDGSGNYTFLSLPAGDYLIAKSFFTVNYGWFASHPDWHPCF